MDGRGEGNRETGSGIGRDRREAQSIRIINGNIHLPGWEMGVGGISRKSKSLGSGRLLGLNAGELS